MNRTKWLAALVSVLAAGLVAWTAFSPGLTLRSMRASARDGDHAALARHVDAPAVRRSLQQQISASMALAASDMAAAKGMRLRGRDAKAVYDQAGQMVAGMDPVALVAGALVGADGSPRNVEVRRQSFARFEAGRPGMVGGMQYELRGVRWTVVAIVQSRPGTAR